MRGICEEVFSTAATEISLIFILLNRPESELTCYECLIRDEVRVDGLALATLKPLVAHNLWHGDGTVTAQ